MTSLDCFNIAGRDLRLFIGWALGPFVEPAMSDWLGVVEVMSNCIKCGRPTFGRYCRWCKP
jgi:hypothetical protein